MRDLKMTRTALETASSLLLLVSIIQGFQDVQVDHYKTMEAVVGQNTSLPCIVQNISNFKIVSTEWSKKDTSLKSQVSKLALHTPPHGSNYFSSNSTLQIIKNDAGMFSGTYLELHNINKWHEGTYICEISTFPFGSLKKKTELRIKDKIECDMNRTIEVTAGENVTIHCSAFTNVRFTWTKNEMVVSQSHSLQLLSVRKSDSGLYTLTVDTGNNRLQTEFNITVRTQTSILTTEVTTLSPHYRSSGAPETSSNASVTSSATEYAQSTVTAVPVSYSQPQHSRNTTTAHVHTSLSYNQSETIPTSINYNQSETLSTSSPFVYDTNTQYTPVINETESTVNETELPQANLSKSFNFTTSASTILLENITKTLGATQTSRPHDVTVQQGPAKVAKRNHLLVAFIIVGGVLLAFVGFILYRKRMIKKRLDLPPPFKPPPPPVKYTAVRTHKQPFPTDRCNSITAEMVEIKRSNQTEP